MSYTEKFGGGTINPAQPSYLRLDIAADVQLRWPLEQNTSANVVADIIDVDASVPGLNVDMPDARQSSTGPIALINNIGAETVTVRDMGGDTILSLASGEAWYVYLYDNTTQNGGWRTTQFGASVASASAAALAGAGLKAVGTTLNQRMGVRASSSSPVTVQASDRAAAVLWTGGVGVANLPDPAAVGADWFTAIRNSGTGDLTVTPPSGQIDGASALTVSPGESTFVVTDGTNFFSIGYGQSTTGIFDFTIIAVPGSGTYTLSGVELNRVAYRFTGTLTGDRTIVVPSSVQQYWIDNETTGAFVLTVKTAAQVQGVVVPQGARNILYCDGTNVVPAESATVSFPVAVSQGGTGATTADNARIALEVPPQTRQIISGDGLSGGGDLTQNRVLTVGEGDGISVGADDVSVDILGIEDLADPSADRIPFFDDSAGAFAWLRADQSDGLAISGTDLEILFATEAETRTGHRPPPVSTPINNRTVTPEGLHSFANVAFYGDLTTGPTRLAGSESTRGWSLTRTDVGRYTLIHAFNSTLYTPFIVAVGHSATWAVPAVTISSMNNNGVSFQIRYWDDLNESWEYDDPQIGISIMLIRAPQE